MPPLLQRKNLCAEWSNVWTVQEAGQFGAAADNRRAFFKKEILKNDQC